MNNTWKTIITCALLSSSITFAGEIRSYNLLPGTCMYVGGKKVCAMNPINQIIASEGIILPSQSNQENQTIVVLPNEGSKQLIIVNQPKSGGTQVCKCKIEENSLNSGYTIEKTEIGTDGKTKKTFIKVTPNTEGCDCK